MKKILLPLIIAATAAIAPNATAQDFTVTHDTSVTVTAGSTEDVYVYNTLTNVSTSNITYSYRLVNWETLALPIGWNIIGFCDNIACLPFPNWDEGETNTGLEMAPGDVSDLKLQVNVSPTADNGTAFFHFEVKTAGQTKNVFYKLTKEPTGMSLVPVSDNSINLYPNPANGSSITLFVAPQYNASQFAMYDITGKQVASIQSNGTAAQTLNIQNLAAGVYSVQVVDASGQLIAVRNFVKK